MRASVNILAQCAFLSIAFGAEDPPPLPSYNLGITGEPTKVDTAFGNLGDVGPVYEIPEMHNESAVTSGGNPQYSTSAPIAQTTEPPKISQQTTTIAQQGSLNGSNVEVTTTVAPTEAEGISSQEPGNVYSTTSVANIELSPSTNPTQTFDTTTVPNSTPNSDQTTVPKETPTSTASGVNITTDAQNTTTPATASSGAAIPSTPSSIPISKPTSTQGSMGQTTPSEPPTQTFHTGSPNSTNAPPVTTPKPGNNTTKPSTNSTTPSKPNSSLYLYPNNVSIWLTLAVLLFLCYE